MEKQYFDKMKKKPKKRGKKSSNKIIEITDEELNDSDKDCIIAHIPLNITDIDKYTDIKESDVSQNELSFDNPSIFDSTSNISFDDKYVKSLEMKIDELKRIINENDIETNTEVFSNDYNIEKISGLVLLSDNGEFKITEKSDICCWWCCHQFNNIPFPLPNKFYKEKFYIFGNFCSPSCAMSYNLDINDYKVWERNSLIIKLFNSISNNQLEEIYPAPPRQRLKIFGGMLDIKNFRKKSIILNSSRFIIPPMVPIVTLIEESYKDRNKYKWDKKLNMSRYNKLTKNIKLKRSKKPLNHNNTLEKVMGLRKIKF